MSNLKVSDPYLWSILQNEKKKQKEVINLIASENYTSAAVLEAIGSVFVNKYPFLCFAYCPPFTKNCNNLQFYFQRLL